MKVIQVGMGGMGNAWINAVKRSDVVDFAGFVEVNAEVAKSQAKEHQLDESTIYTTLDDALQNLDADGVINVTPPQFHKDISFIALDAGLPVLCEKPLAGTLEDSRAIVAKANETSVLHTITQNYRYSAVAQTMKQVLDNGDLGGCRGCQCSIFQRSAFWWFS